MLADVKPKETTQEKPVLDRESFQQLLAAAFVLQEQNERVPTATSAPDYNQALAEFVEIQSLIQGHQIDLQSAASLICRRSQQFTSADGAAIGIVKENELAYVAASGTASEQSGIHIALASSLAAHTLVTGQMIRSLDAQKDRRLPTQLCRDSDVEGLIAVPARHEGKVAGLLELHFSKKNAFQEQDVRTCQLMAGLWAEAIARMAELEWKKTLAAERATMIEALERIKPQLERSAVCPSNPLEIAIPAEVKPVAFTEVVHQTEPQELEEKNKKVIEAACSSCGRQMSDDEFFCGICGTARPIESGSSGDLQSKWASLWRLKQAETNRKNAEELAGEADAAPKSPQVVHETAVEEEYVDALTEPVESQIAVLPEARPTAWTSSARAQQRLESLPSRPKRSWVLQHRANLYLATSAILLLAVILGYGTEPSPATAANQGRRNAAPQLSLFEKALVGMGLALPPSAPVYHGNPETKVWEDTRTALYYCPGSDLYGKTERGKFSSQRDAQLDQFEPAFRKPCE